MDNEKETVWTDDMGFMPPVKRTEGRTVCQYECQLIEYKAEIERLENIQGRLIGTFRVNMMRLSPEYNHEGFDEVIAALKEGE